MEAMDIDEIDIQTILPGYDSVKTYTEDAFKAVVGATKAALALPDSGSKYEYYRSFHGFCELMKEEGKIIFSAMSTLAKSQGIKKSFEDLNIEDAFELLSEVNDIILEHADLALDEATGAKAKDAQLPEELVVASVRTSQPINTSWNKVLSPSTTNQTIRLLTAKNILRPQMKFREKVDNSNTPFVPLIKEKPNSIKPLAILPEMIDGKEEFGHPYEWEIEKFQPTDEMLETAEPVMPDSVEETHHIYIETEEDLQIMHEDLRLQKEIAIDLEHHSYRSFQGFVCLMQISTRSNDYIVDTLKLRSELQILNDIFTDPKIIKVFHGADMDIVWLQRDFGLYIVNMFDTGQAARVLNFAHFSLAYVLKHYCKLETNKTFQLADWRIRPLPDEMIKYAREDTHYLLYIYDSMKNELLQKGNEVKNLLLSAFQRSKNICLRTYEKPLFHDDSYLELLKKSKKVFNSRQLFALKEIYAWRDRTAREVDESVGYVLPNHMLLQIAEILPREQQGILACCNPIPPMVRSQLADLHSIILQARDAAVAVFLESEKTPRPPEINVDVDLENILHCPHDIHHHDESLHLSSLFGDSASVSNTTTDEISVKKQPSLPLFGEGKSDVEFQAESSKGSETKKYKDAVEAAKKYLSPYQRYHFAKKFSSANKMVDDEEEESITVTDRVHKMQDHFKRLAAVADGDEDLPARRVSPKKPTSENTPVVVPNENNKKPDVTPLRKKEKKKRHKRKVENINDSVEIIADHAAPSSDTVETSPPKKTKTSENTDKSTNEDRTPFNYFKTLSNGPEGGKNKIPSKKVFNPDDDAEEYQSASKLHSKKKKHSKQGTFSHGSDKSHSDKKNWPKR